MCVHVSVLCVCCVCVCVVLCVCVLSVYVRVCVKCACVRAFTIYTNTIQLWIFDTLLKFYGLIFSFQGSGL